MANGSRLSTGRTSSACARGGKNLPANHPELTPAAYFSSSLGASQTFAGVNMEGAWAEGSFDFSGSPSELAEHVIAVLNTMGNVKKVDKSSGRIKARLNKPSMMAGYSSVEAIIMSAVDGSRVDITISSPASYAKGADTQAITELNEFGRQLEARATGGQNKAGW